MPKRKASEILAFKVQIQDWEDFVEISKALGITTTDLIRAGYMAFVTAKAGNLPEPPKEGPKERLKLIQIPVTAEQLNRIDTGISVLTNYWNNTDYNRSVLGRMVISWLLDYFRRSRNESGSYIIEMPLRYQ